MHLWPSSMVRFAPSFFWQYYWTVWPTRLLHTYTFPPFILSFSCCCATTIYYIVVQYNFLRSLNVSMIYARIFLLLLRLIHNDIVEKNVLSCLVIELAMNLHERRQNKSSNPRIALLHQPQIRDENSSLLTLLFYELWPSSGHFCKGTRRGLDKKSNPLWKMDGAAAAALAIEQTMAAA